MRTLLLLPVLCAVAVAIGGCGLSKERQAAEVVAQQYYDALKSKHYDKAISYYDASFFKQTPKAEWRKILEKLPTKLGEPKTEKLVGWRLNKQARAGGMSGTFCTLNYQVTYAKYPSQEVLVLYKPLGGKGFGIAGHNINSKGLLK